MPDRRMICRGPAYCWSHAAHDVNGPTFAQAILTTDELITAFGAN